MWKLNEQAGASFLRFLAETFIEAFLWFDGAVEPCEFPILFGGTFIEALIPDERRCTCRRISLSIRKGFQ